jgi:hypothetical protein
MMKYYMVETNYGRFLFKNESDSSFEKHHIAHILRRSFRTVDVVSVDVRDEYLHSGYRVSDYQTLEQIFVKAVPHGNNVELGTVEDFRLQPASWESPPAWWSVVVNDVISFPIPTDQKAIRKHNRQYSMWHWSFLNMVSRYNIDSTTSPSEYTGYDKEVVSRLIIVYDAVNSGRINQSQFITEMERIGSIRKNDYHGTPLGWMILNDLITNETKEPPFYVSFSPPHVPGGSACFCTVSLSQVSPRPTVISVAHESYGLVTIPNRITIEPGLSKSTFEIKTFPQKSPTKCELVFSDGSTIVSRSIEIL